LIQRVAEAQVHVDGREVGAIGRGLLLLLGVEAGDGPAEVDKLLHKIVNYRVFPDAEGRMNRSLLDVAGGLLVVSQFTLVADTRKGLRPSFSSAAVPAQAEQLYERFLQRAREQHGDVITLASGRFAADMQVSLVNDGPVTFLLESGNDGRQGRA